MIIYKGKSLIDKEPIIVITTNGSRNRKTGTMLQTWILREDVNPLTAIKTGKDYSICGNCVHRGKALGDKTSGRSCYVNVGQAPLQVYKKYILGGYRKINKRSLWKVGYNKFIRLGSYGDPMSVPIEIWRELCSYAKNWTGYTHQWKLRLPGYSEYRRYLMASVESPEEAELARAKGWRTFRIRLKNWPLMENEIICPASPEGNFRRTCVTCGACSGGSNPTNVSIVLHHNPLMLSSATKKLIGLQLV